LIGQDYRKQGFIPGLSKLPDNYYREARRGEREQSDNLAGLQLPDGKNPFTQPLSADLLIINTVKNSPDKVTLLTLGPLTNLAEAILRDDSFLESIEQTYVMGGALDVLGNVGFSGVDIDNQVAEWNIFIDPLAARIVLASGAPVTLVPLDATNQVPVTLEFYFKLQANRRTPEADFVYDVLSSLLGEIGTGYSSFWDPLTASLLVDESLGYIKQGHIWVSTDPGTTSGLTRLLSSGFPARYAKSADASRFEYEFLRTLNQP
jgi:pyrimidine-specific ribonucleoside hydrolase